MVSKALVAEVPRSLFEGDWIIDMENDYKFLEDHFQTKVGEYLWIREKHKLWVQLKASENDYVWVEYADGEKRVTTLLREEVRFDGRWIPPVAMIRNACRFILKVKEIETRWADPEKRSRLIWVVGIERVADPNYLFEQERRGVLK